MFLHFVGVLVRVDHVRAVARSHQTTALKEELREKARTK